MAIRGCHFAKLSVAVGAVLCALLMVQVDATVGKKVKACNLKGLVTDSHSRPIAGATVYLIDTAAIDMTPLNPVDIRSGASEGYDEPLEDIVRNAEKAKTLPQAVTNAKGQFKLKLRAGTTYFPFVVPGAEDKEHFPGGDASRVAIDPKNVAKTGLRIKLSWKAPADATRIGSTACYACHGAGSTADASGCKKHGHALQFNKPGKPTANQDPANHPGASVLALQEKFTTATAYNKPVTGTTVQTLYFNAYNTTSKNFAVFENTAGTGTNWVKAYLWRTAVDGDYNITLQNVINPSDPNNLKTFRVKVFMGAYLRQRIFVEWPGLKSGYAMLEYRAMPGSASQGMNGSYDRSRVAFAESSFTSFYDGATKLIKTAAAAGASNLTCGLCHLGFNRTDTAADPVTGENLAYTIADPNGVFDLGGDGVLQDVGIGCEECHGNGSKHREEALKGSTTTQVRGKTVVGNDNTAKHIINPALLDASRSSLLCGRCHDARGIMKEHSAHEVAPPGISRAEFLHEYVDAKGLSVSNLWPDGESGRGGHHGFTYDNWLISKHANNPRRMVACDDCHDSMGNSSFRYFVKGDPDDPINGACSSCHDKHVGEHATEMAGSPMSGASMACIECHMTRTGKAGAGRPGLILGTPTGGTTDANLMYFQGDQSAHHMHVPTKFTVGAAGVAPGTAMPIPYTNACACCHDASKLQYQGPAQ